MIGLLVKDIRLLLGQKKFLVMILLIAILFVASGQNPMFAVVYCTVVGFIFTLNTISYDEFDNGYGFLLTLPVSRKGYVLEKYLFGLLVGGGIWILSMTLGAFYVSGVIEEFQLLVWIRAAFPVLRLVFMFACVTFPLYFKYGAEKGKIATVAFAMLIVGGSATIRKVEGAAEALQAKLIWLQGLGALTWYTVGILAFAVVTAGSILISIRIMEKKQL